MRDSSIALRTPIGYRLHLAGQTGTYCPHGTPQIESASKALKTRDEWEQAIAEVDGLGLPRHIDGPKNWDSLIALKWILQSQDKHSHILDAGAESYSVILPWLFLYGFKRLTGINLTFQRPLRRGWIKYQYGDITRTRFENGSFGAITCLSVLEHGVSPSAYFSEASRLLRPGGLLITSVDYYPSSIDTFGKTAYGVPIRVFSRQDAEAMLEMAREYDLYPLDDVDLDCQNKPVKWEEQGLKYTFLIFGLRKPY